MKKSLINELVKIMVNNRNWFHGVKKVVKVTVKDNEYIDRSVIHYWYDPKTTNIMAVAHATKFNKVTGKETKIYAIGGIVGTHAFPLFDKYYVTNFWEGFEKNSVRLVFLGEQRCSNVKRPVLMDDDGDPIEQPNLTVSVYNNADLDLSCVTIDDDIEAEHKLKARQQKLRRAYADGKIKLSDTQIATINEYVWKWRQKHCGDKGERVLQRTIMSIIYQMDRDGKIAI